MIRKATINDMPDVLRMGQEFYKEAPYSIPFDVDSLRETVIEFIEADEADAILLVSEVDGKTVGMLAGVLTPLYYNKSYKQAQEYWWWVDKDFRGSKEGVSLFEAYESWATFYGACQMSVCTMTSNVSLCKFFESRGYSQKDFCFTKEV